MFGLDRLLLLYLFLMNNFQINNIHLTIIVFLKQSFTNNKLLHTLLVICLIMIIIQLLLIFKAPVYDDHLRRCASFGPKPLVCMIGIKA